MTNEDAKKGFRAGFVAIVGRPNAGKSTLVNHLVGQKIAIVTSKPQTTRNRIQGIVTRDDGQVVLIDTPGLHDAKTVLNKQMMREVAAALEGIDVLVLMVDASETLANQGNRMQPHVDPLLIQRAKRFEGRTILALNKVDKAPKNKLLPLMEEFAKVHPFEAMVPIAALKGEGCDELLREVMKLLPEGQPYFPEDQVTDQPERFLASEIVREKAIALTYHEVPHALAVAVDKWEETPKLLRIQMTLTVERPSQKKILIGRKGDMLKKIGTQARKELEEILSAKIYLGLFVKVAENWRENPMAVRELDWHTQLEALEKYNAE
ncbi:MAG TPA: GTPase Era [Candidatus Eisenbacteria bacterium]|nr:GTPase Era [Candidatus Eisenbacteria bacterium]